MANVGFEGSEALADTMADRFDYVLQRWGQAAGGTMPGFSNPTYLSERKTADRNFALGYFMREKGAFPEGTDLVETLEFYFQCCSLELTAEAMSVVAATLANGGVCPLTGERVFQSGTVRKCLSLMSSCGMYDFSGEWAFRVGLPAKSGVSGVIMIVVPNVMGLVCWSPRLDENGNSVRGSNSASAWSTPSASTTMATWSAGIRASAIPGCSVNKSPGICWSISAGLPARATLMLSDG